jgi:hypothetical protein
VRGGDSGSQVTGTVNGWKAQPACSPDTDETEVDVGGLTALYVPRSRLVSCMYQYPGGGGGRLCMSIWMVNWILVEEEVAQFFQSME